MAILQKAEQRFFLKNKEVRGVQSVDIQYDSRMSTAKFAGLELNVPVFEGVGNNTIGINRALISSCPFYEYVTGSGVFDGFIVKPNNVNTYNFYGFTKGTVTNYNISFAVGEIPKTSITIKSIGNVGKLSIDDSTVISDIATDNIVRQGIANLNPFSIECNFGNIDISKVFSCDLSIAKPFQPTHYLGEVFPSTVMQAQTQQVSLNLSLGAEEYENIKQSLFPQTRVFGNVDLSIKDANNSGVLASYSFENLELISESYTTNVDNIAVVSLNFITSREFKKEIPIDGLQSYYDKTSKFQRLDLYETSIENQVPYGEFLNYTNPIDTSPYIYVNDAFPAWADTQDFSRDSSIISKIIFDTAVLSESETEYGLFCFHNGNTVMTAYTNIDATQAYLGLRTNGDFYETTIPMLPLDGSEVAIIFELSPSYCTFTTYSENPSWGKLSETITFPVEYATQFSPYFNNRLNICQLITGVLVAGGSINNLGIYKRVLGTDDVNKVLKSFYNV